MDTIFNHPEVTSVIAALVLLGIGAKILKYSFERIAKWYLYIATLAVVIVMDSIFFPFIGGKDYFFRFAVELALAAGVLWWAFEAKAGELMRRVKAAYKNPLVIAVTAFVVMFLLASLFALDAHAAFWSNYERGEGGFQMLHYYAFFMLLVVFLTEERDWKNIFNFSLVAAMGMIIYGIAANFGAATFIGPYTGTTQPAGFWHALTDGRFEGSLGNPAYVAPYLMFAMFFAAYLWMKAWKNKAVRAIASWGYGILIAIFLFFFIVSQTRGAFLGLGAAVIAFIIYLIVAAKGNTRKWAAIALCLIALLGATGYAVRNNPIVEKIPAGRLLQLSLSDSTAQTRFWVWGEAWKGFEARPVLGWGPENFTAVYDKYFDTRFYVPNQSTETWFDRAHSVYFDYLVETGLLGLLAYLSIFVVYYWSLFKVHRKRRGEKEEIVERGLLIAMPIAYLVQGAAIFDVLPMYLSLFLFLGFAVYYFNGRETNITAK